MTLQVLARSDSDGLLFVDKPAGLLVHNSAFAGPREHTLVDDVRTALDDTWSPLHRLDRQTSGVIAFARADVMAQWQRELEERARKIYWALVRGHVRDDVVRIDHAIVDEDTGVSRAAVSEVRVLARSSVERCSWVEVELLEGGRRHQVRRHLKHIAHPIIGDANHGKGPINRDYRARFGVTRMALHARALTLAAHHVVAELPDDLRAPRSLLFPGAQ